MHFLINIPDVKEEPKDCMSCPFRTSAMDMYSNDLDDYCSLNGKKITGMYGDKLNDCHIIKGFDTPIIAFPITIHPKEPTTIEETNDGYYMECSNEETTYYITFNNEDESYDDLNMWNGEGD